MLVSAILVIELFYRQTEDTGLLFKASTLTQGLNKLQRIRGFYA